MSYAFINNLKLLDLFSYAGAVALLLHSLRASFDTAVKLSFDRPKADLPTKNRNPNSTVVKYWDYDALTTNPRHARTHFLSSIQPEHRLGLEVPTATTSDWNVSEALDRYVANPNNTFPQKLHLAETNPSLARLPAAYKKDPAWTRAFSSSVVYLASYRVTDLHNCFGHGYQVPILYGGNWSHWRYLRTGKKWAYKAKTEHLGIALLDADLNVIADVTVMVKDVMFKEHFEDYRIFNLRGGQDNDEELYLTTFGNIVPIRVSVQNNNETGNDLAPPTGFVELPQAFPGSPSQPPFRVFIRSYYSCPPKDSQWSGRIKNLMYFDEPDENAKTTTTRFVSMPSVIPNRVYPVDLEQKCNESIRMEAPYINRKLERNAPPYPDPSFRAVHNRRYQDHEVFLNDRGSACCTRIPRNRIRLDPSMEALYPTSTTTHKDGIDDTLLVGIVHPRTRDKAVDGMPTRAYFSRFVAMLPRAPYTVVARSGAFCLGYPEEDEMGNDFASMNNRMYLEHFRRERPLSLLNATFPKCPKIHFAMSIVDKVSETHIDEDEDSVIISYGVQDCMSRFIEVTKSDVADMLSQKTMALMK
mmetsp:Transcript_2843/g.7807  ORF Transcript_2843/g.7807 Transcript_2843/m.7807 type:complete len:584 (+) Transcript_2843:123-1874(+)|eukprot:CAMPEP_0197194786 /NCGR_PEP_ID=MMETSP1423-20130617/29866_1 /TAXON_ID=476441 /ORGANISM="Pseudo-nitzschia heimii, Strain UNC1101" /LENGTH=583 /DNA_ID=CAMNT_0042648267 /DNA_START=57 /DNA_END=1808 /DNA_ORIENTATION=+